jgi:acyl-CoA reductase-like NAD-dependent aldehyde dehydrogenase
MDQYINGRCVKEEANLSTFQPATDEVIATVNAADKAQRSSA